MLTMSSKSRWPRPSMLSAMYDYTTVYVFTRITSHLFSIVPQRSCHQVASAWFEGCCWFEADQEGIVWILQSARTITKIWNIGRKRLLSLFGSHTPTQLRGWQHLFIDSCTRWRVWWCAQPMGYQLLRAHSSREGVLPWPREDQKVL